MKKSATCIYDLERLLEHAINTKLEISGIGPDRWFGIWQEHLPEFVEAELRAQGLEKGDPDFAKHKADIRRNKQNSMARLRR